MARFGSTWLNPWRPYAPVSTANGATNCGAPKPPIWTCGEPGRRRPEWLLQRHDAHRQERRFRAPAGAFVRAIASHSGHNKRAIRVLSAHHGSETLAAVLFLRHGDSATYYIGYNGGAGRTRHVHNLLLWQGLARLKDDGVAWLDLGGIDGRRMAGVSRFKLGLGGAR